MVRSKIFWPAALVILIVGLLILGTGMGALAAEPPYPVNCPKATPVSCSPTSNPDWFNSSVSYPGLGSADLKPDKLPILSGCVQSGYLKIDGDQNEVDTNYYQLGGILTPYGTNDGFQVYIWNNGDGTFAWASNYPVYYVYAKGGPDGGNLYTYPDGDNSDCGLSQGSSGWSHIVFYYCVPQLEIDASITAQGIWEAVYDWDIDKTVDIPEHYLFRGESGTSNYTITVTKNLLSETTDIIGTAYVENTGQLLAQGINVTVTLYQTGIVDPLDTVSSSIGDLPSGAIGSYDFTFENIGFTAGSTYRVEATATASNGEHSAADTDSYEVAPVLALANGSEPDTIHLDDNWYEGDLGSFSESGTASYQREFDCTEGCDYTAGGCTYNNIAEIVETDDWDDANVIVWCYELDPDLSADYEWTRQYGWNIDKSVDKDLWQLFKGDQATSAYTVAVEKYLDSENYKISGFVQVDNPAPMTAGGVTVCVSLFDENDLQIGLTQTPLVDQDILAFGYISSDFEFDLNFQEGANYTVVTSVDFTGSGRDDPDNPADATANIGPVYPEDTYDTITVNDTNGLSWTTSGNSSWSYSETFECSEMCGGAGDGCIYDNTATIVETGQSDSAAVTVECYELEVSKDADTSYTRDYDWTIVKEGDLTSLTLAEGQSFLVNYQLSVDAVYTDSDWSAAGTITIYNPAPIDATINSITDLISPDIAATVDFTNITFPYTLGAGETLALNYSTVLQDAASRLNTVTITQQNYDLSWVSDGAVSAPDGTTEYQADAAVNFLDPSEEVDEFIEVTDTLFGDLGIVSYADLPYTFYYTLDVGPYYLDDNYACGGVYQFENIADFLTNDNGETGADSWIVSWTIPCPGCTLTPGYWKTHSGYGPAPYDETWADVNEDTPFFLSGQSYYEVLWTAPGGNAYYNLAHAYIAAELNFLNGASDTSQVESAFAEATMLFEAYTPAQVEEWKGNKGERATFLSLAQILDNYNNGLIGPGHCSEDDTSAE